jgi:hypothetical protein
MLKWPVMGNIIFHSPLKPSQIIFLLWINISKLVHFFLLGENRGNYYAVSVYAVSIFALINFHKIWYKSYVIRGHPQDQMF